jgi:hypothetical protein
MLTDAFAIKKGNGAVVQLPKMFRVPTSVGSLSIEKDPAEVGSLGITAFLLPEDTASGQLVDC